MGQAPVSEVLSITSLVFTALLQMKEADEHNYAGLVWCVGKKKRKYVDHFSKIDQSNTYAHIDVISRESVEKKTPWSARH